MRYAFLLFLISLPLVIAPHVLAAKPRIRPAVSKNVAVASGYSKAKLSRNTNSVVVTFQNLSNVKSITYTLAYSANGTEQGVMGSITPSGAATETRDLYFGTCSHGVCTEHRNITKASLTVVTTLKSGKTHTKIYRIKV